MSTQLAYTFADGALRERALSHRSVGADNNERLEFFGDALVNLIVTEQIYERFPKADEGELTRLRARLVSEAALARIAREIDLGAELRLGPGELKSGGFRRDSILADAFEAMIAAVYLDGGWGRCRELVRGLFEPHVIRAASGEDKDAKTRLQEWLQARAQPLPNYELLATSGADHAKVFEIECVITAFDLHVRGSGGSRRAAEQLAAANALAQLKARDQATQ